jgi:hypothetical protein
MDMWSDSKLTPEIQVDKIPGQPVKRAIHFRRGSLLNPAATLDAKGLARDHSKAVALRKARSEAQCPLPSSQIDEYNDDTGLRHITNDIQLEYVHSFRKNLDEEALNQTKNARKMRQLFSQTFNQKAMSLTEIMQVETNGLRRLFNPHISKVKRSDIRKQCGIYACVSQPPRKPVEPISQETQDIFASKKETDGFNSIDPPNALKKRPKNFHKKQKFALEGDCFLCVFQTNFLKEVLFLTATGRLYHLRRHNADFELAEVDTKGFHVSQVAFSGAMIYLLAKKGSKQLSAQVTPYQLAMDMRKLTRSQKRGGHRRPEPLRKAAEAINPKPGRLGRRQSIDRREPSRQAEQKAPGLCCGEG